MAGFFRTYAAFFAYIAYEPVFYEVHRLVAALLRVFYYKICEVLIALRLSVKISEHHMNALGYGHVYVCRLGAVHLLHE